MEQHYIEALKADNNFVIKELYNNNRSAFLGFAKKYSIAETDAVDIYQDAFISLRKHAISGNLIDVKSGIKTYLFGIGKHLIYKKLKEKNTKTDFESIVNQFQNDFEEIKLEIEEEMTEEQQILQFFFRQLGKSCQQMLTLSFYRGLTNEEIAILEGYENEAVVRSQKSRCLKTLKDLIKKPPKNE